MPTRRLVLPAILLVALTACRGGTDEAAPQPTATTTTAAPTATPTPGATPTTKPTAKPTVPPTAKPTAKPSPTKAPLPQATGPAPKHFLPVDFSFIGASFGWALGCGSPTCPAVVARTTDAGRTWHETAAPPVKVNDDSGDSVRAIRFGTQDHGWLYGPQLWATHNGGKSWKQLPTDGDVIALEQAKGVTWLVVSSCEAGGCRLSLWTAPSASDAFVLRSVIPGTDANEKTYQLVRAGSTHGWLVGIGNGGKQILRTTDGGKTWKEIANPCTSQDTYTMRLTRYDTQTLWLACGSDAGAGQQAKTVWHSSDAGSHWGSSTKPPSTGLLLDIQAFGSRTALLAVSHGPLLRTTDGGITWQGVASGPDDAGWNKVETINFRNVWALSGHAIYRSADAGRTWGKYTFTP
ncbi:MAG TPA: YCF48-related protein [Mycobacteriales bacterium]